MRLLVMENIPAGSAVATHTPNGREQPPQLFMWRQRSQNFPLALGLIGKTSVDLIKGMYVDAVNDPDAGNGLKITPVQTPKGMIALRTPEGALYFKHKDNYPESFDDQIAEVIRHHNQQILLLADDQEVATYVQQWQTADGRNFEGRRIPAMPPPSDAVLRASNSQRNISASSDNLAADLQARLKAATEKEERLKKELEQTSKEVLQLHAALAAISIVQ